ncbi:MAG: TetR/AcrR family transcriptional regulator [Hyphomicrobiaceae bacterium]
MIKTNTRGRPRSFDARTALRSAMRVFWANGFNATSYDALERATALRRQSLIYAFGDKRSMFCSALDLYAQDRIAEVISMLETPGSPLDNVRAVFASWLRDAQNPAHRGCLIVNTAGEFGRSDPVVADAIAHATDRLRAAFGRAFERAIEAGELGPDHDPHALAELAIVAGDGALLHARVSARSDHAARAIGAFLKLLR